MTPSHQEGTAFCYGDGTHLYVGVHPDFSIDYCDIEGDDPSISISLMSL